MEFVVCRCSLGCAKADDDIELVAGLLSKNEVGMQHRRLLYIARIGVITRGRLRSRPNTGDNGSGLGNIFGSPPIGVPHRKA